MISTRPSFRILALVAVVSIAGAWGAATLASPVGATHAAAGTLLATSSTVEVLAPGHAVTLLAGTLHAPEPVDLLLSVTLECSILVEAPATVDDPRTFGRVEAWVEIDGAPVPVGDADDGRVVLCNRAHAQGPPTPGGGDALLEDHLATRVANAFRWAALDVGAGAHAIVVKGELTGATAGLLAKGTVGKRTFVAKAVETAGDAVG